MYKHTACEITETKFNTKCPESKLLDNLRVRFRVRVILPNSSTSGKNVLNNTGTCQLTELVIKYNPCKPIKINKVLLLIKIESDKNIKASQCLFSLKKGNKEEKLATIIGIQTIV